MTLFGGFNRSESRFRHGFRPRPTPLSGASRDLGVVGGRRGRRGTGFGAASTGRRAGLMRSSRGGGGGGRSSPTRSGPTPPSFVFLALVLRSNQSRRRLVAIRHRARRSRCRTETGSNRRRGIRRPFGAAARVAVVTAPTSLAPPALATPTHARVPVLPLLGPFLLGFEPSHDRFGAPHCDRDPGFGACVLDPRFKDFKLGFRPSLVRVMGASEGEDLFGGAFGSGREGRGQRSGQSGRGRGSLAAVGIAVVLMLVVGGRRADLRSRRRGRECGWFRRSERRDQGQERDRCRSLLAGDRVVDVRTLGRTKRGPTRARETERERWDRHVAALTRGSSLWRQQRRQEGSLQRRRVEYTSISAVGVAHSASCPSVGTNGRGRWSENGRIKVR